MNPELMKIADEADNPLEALFAAMIYMIIDMIFRILEISIGEE